MFHRVNKPNIKYQSFSNKLFFFFILLSLYSLSITHDSFNMKYLHFNMF